VKTLRIDDDEEEILRSGKDCFAVDDDDDFCLSNWEGAFFDHAVQNGG